MKGEEFQTLVGQLGALSEGQRAALFKALSGAKKPDEVIRLIETQFDASPRGAVQEMGRGGGSQALQVQGLQQDLQRADRDAACDLEAP